MTRLNRVDHEYDARIPQLAYFRQSTRLEPPELVISYNKKQYVWALTWDQFRNITRDASGMYFAATKPDGNQLTTENEIAPRIP